MASLKLLISSINYNLTGAFLLVSTPTRFLRFISQQMSIDWMEMKKKLKFQSSINKRLTYCKNDVDEEVVRHKGDKDESCVAGKSRLCKWNGIENRENCQQMSYIAEGLMQPFEDWPTVSFWIGSMGRRDNGFV